jgi:hypothetical protein
MLAGEDGRDLHASLMAFDDRLTVVSGLDCGCSTCTPRGDGDIFLAGDAGGLIEGN